MFLYTHVNIVEDYSISKRAKYYFNICMSFLDSQSVLFMADKMKR